MKVGKMIHILDNQIKRNMDSIAQQYGLTIIQYIVMEHIKELGENGEIYQRDIERLMNVRRSTVSSVLGLLEGKGFLKREGVKKDARLKKLTLTEQGASVFKQLKTEIDKEDNRMSDIFSDEELRQLSEFMERMWNRAKEKEGEYYGK